MSERLVSSSWSVEEVVGASEAPASLDSIRQLRASWIRYKGASICLVEATTSELSVCIDDR